MSDRADREIRLLDHPDPPLLKAATGLEPSSGGQFVMLDTAIGTKSLQRVALANTGDVTVMLWPGEMKRQALYLYSENRAENLLQAADAAGWEVEMRPHLAFHTSRYAQRMYLHPAISLDDYVAGWSGDDQGFIGQHDAEVVRMGLWPVLLERGYASPVDEAHLEPFLARLGRRPAHVRPGLRLLRVWDRAECDRLGWNEGLPVAIRQAVNALLRSVGDPTLPARPG